VVENDGLGTETACSYSGGGVPVITYSQNITNTTNPFLIYGRASKTNATCSCGRKHDGLGTETACSFSGFSQDQTELNYNLLLIMQLVSG
jgi:hypothetical protein